MTIAESPSCSAFTWPYRIEEKMGSIWSTVSCWEEADLEPAKEALAKVKRNLPRRTFRLIRMSFEEIR